jgi:hypothetical protein
LLKYLLKDCTENPPVCNVMSCILIDKSCMDFPDASQIDGLNQKGIQLLGMDLANAVNGSIIDEKKLIPILLSLA